MIRKEMLAIIGPKNIEEIADWIEEYFIERREARGILIEIWKEIRIYLDEINESIRSIHENTNSAEHSVIERIIESRFNDRYRKSSEVKDE